MTEYKKPLPVIQPWSQAFWEGTQNNKLLIQECKECGVKIFYPRKSCPECWSSNLTWSEASGKGKIYAYTVTMGGVEQVFAEDLPYVLAYVDLDEGVRMMTRIVGCNPDELKIGMGVEVIFEKVAGEMSLPFFKPIQ
ncbi:MAG: Zn-ribbon domain-containing OB-fold protein [Pseudomonadota bacterium]